MARLGQFSRHLLGHILGILVFVLLATVAELASLFVVTSVSGGGATILAVLAPTVDVYSVGFVVWLPTWFALRFFRGGVVKWYLILAFSAALAFGVTLTSCGGSGHCILMVGLYYTVTFAICAAAHHLVVSGIVDRPWKRKISA